MQELNHLPTIKSFMSRLALVLSFKLLLDGPRATFGAIISKGCLLREKMIPKPDSKQPQQQNLKTLARLYIMRRGSSRNTVLKAYLQYLQYGII